MNLQNATSKELICLNCDFSTKLEAIQFLIDKLDKAGKLKEKEAFFKSVLEREDISATGIDMGLAVPHGKKQCSKRSSFCCSNCENTHQGLEEHCRGKSGFCYIFTGNSGR